MRKFVILNIQYLFGAYDKLDFDSRHFSTRE